MSDGRQVAGVARQQQHVVVGEPEAGRTSRADSRGSSTPPSYRWAAPASLSGAAASGARSPTGIRRVSGLAGQLDPAAQPGREDDREGRLVVGPGGHHEGGGTPRGGDARDVTEQPGADPAAAPGRVHGQVHRGEPGLVGGRQRRLADHAAVDHRPHAVDVDVVRRGGGRVEALPGRPRGAVVPDQHVVHEVGQRRGPRPLGGRERRQPTDLDRHVADGQVEHVLHRAQRVTRVGLGLGVEQGRDDLGEGRRAVEHGARRLDVARRLVDERRLGGRRDADLRAAGLLEELGEVGGPPLRRHLHHQLVGHRAHAREDLEADDVDARLPALAGQDRQGPGPVGQHGAHSPQHGGDCAGAVLRARVPHVSRPQTLTRQKFTPAHADPADVHAHRRRPGRS